MKILPYSQGREFLPALVAALKAGQPVIIPGARQKILHSRLTHAGYLGYWIATDPGRGCIAKVQNEKQR